MTRGVRFVVFGLGVAGLVLLYALAVAGMPRFGTDRHPYRDLAVPAAVRHATANAVASVNFDQRALDTLGEETILLGSVVGAAALLRRSKEETERRRPESGRTPEAAVLLSYALLPATLLIGLDVVLHGHITPGGGFQGGVVLATGLHLVYLAGRYRMLQKVRPLDWYEWAEGGSTALFAGVGLAGLTTGAGFLANILPHGTFGDLLSAGTVAVLNIAVGCAVAGGAVVLLAQFLTQAIEIGQR